MLSALKEEVLQANLELKAKGLVVSTWGNVSGFDEESECVAIKPSGVPYAQLTPEKMVVVDLDGQIVEGELKPSSDTPTHLELYRNFPEIGGVAHSHSPWATGWAQAQRGIPCFGTTHSDHFYGEVPCSRPLKPQEVEDQYELNTGRVIVETFQSGGDPGEPGQPGDTGGPRDRDRSDDPAGPGESSQPRDTGDNGKPGQPRDPRHTPGILVASHGPFTWGGDCHQAVKHSVILEEVAKIAVRTLQIEPSTGSVPRYLMDKHFLRKHGDEAYYGQEGR